MNRKREDTIMKSKKILAVLMAAGMTLSLAACGSSSDSTDKSADNGSDSGKTYKIGILQQLEHAALDEATKGFEDAVVSITDDSADIVINAGELTSQQIAQVQDIVKRKAGIAADKIVITPVKVKSEK